MFLQSLGPKMLTYIRFITSFLQIYALVKAMSYPVKRKEATYHFPRELFAKIGLPKMDGVDEIVKRENEEWLKRLEKKKQK